jgi:hypothetical protein
VFLPWMPEFSEKISKYFFSKNEKGPPCSFFMAYGLWRMANHKYIWTEIFYLNTWLWHMANHKLNLWFMANGKPHAINGIWQLKNGIWTKFMVYGDMACGLWQMSDIWRGPRSDKYN